MTVIYQTHHIGEADIRIYVTRHALEADLWIYLTEQKVLATSRYYWFVTKQKMESDIKLYFGHRGICELIVHFTYNKGAVGWQKQHPLTRHRLIG